MEYIHAGGVVLMRSNNCMGKLYSRCKMFSYSDKFEVTEAGLTWCYCLQPGMDYAESKRKIRYLSQHKTPRFCSGNGAFEFQAAPEGVDPALGSL